MAKSLAKFWVIWVRPNLLQMTIDMQNGQVKPKWARFEWD